MEKPKKQVTIACGVLIRGRKILLDLRNEPILPESHMKWELPGGKIEWGETPEQALKREFEEETGIIVAAGPLISVYSSIWEYPEFSQHVIVLNYMCDYKGEGVRRNDAKIRKVEWVPVESVFSLELLRGTDMTLVQLLQKD